jgi:hypothetical protein
MNLEEIKYESPYCDYDLEYYAEKYIRKDTQDRRASFNKFIDYYASVLFHKHLIHVRYHKLPNCKCQVL